MLKGLPLFVGVLFVGCSTAPVVPPRAGPDYDLEIGRASCRERV